MAAIKIIEGPGSGSECPLGAYTSLGRSRDCTVQIKDALSSRLHAEIVPDGDKFLLRDCGSSNGTLLNEQRVKQQALNPGDRIRIGKVVLVFISDAGDASRPLDATRPMDVARPLDVTRELTPEEIAAGQGATPESDLEPVAEAAESVAEVAAEAAEGDAVLEPVDEPPTLPGFRFDRFIRRDGPLTIFAATELELNRPVAIEWLKADASGLPSLDNTLRTLVRLEHPAFPRVFSAGTTDGAAYLVREHVDGQPLSGLCGKLAPAEVADIARELAAALAEAHTAGLIHGSLRPDRIIRTGKGYLKLLGFGLGSALPPGRGPVSRTPLYLAPEQFALAKPSPGTDVYSLGAVLYHLLCGRPPYQGDADEMAVAITSGEFPRVQQVRPNTSRALAHTIERMIAHSPVERFSSMEQVMDDLERLPVAAPIDDRSVTAEVRIVRRSPASTKAIIVLLTLLLMGSIVLLGKLGGTWFVERGVDQSTTPAGTFSR